MHNATALFLINSETPDEAITRFGEAFVSTNTHLSCLMLSRTPDLPSAYMGVPPYGAIDMPAGWAEELESARQGEHARLQEIEAVLAGTKVPGDVQSTFCVLSEIKHAVARRARVTDVSYIAPNLRETAEFREAVSGILYGSPIGIILNCEAPLQPETAFVAWDSSKAASRSVHAALPMLKETKEVFVACFDPVVTESADGANPGSGLAAWLSHHGCNVTVNQYPSGKAEIGTCIQDRAREVGADVVVMGAYGHTRVLQTVFGGTTQTMMEQSGIPVFIAH